MSRHYDTLRRCFQGLLLESEPLSAHTSYRIGGPADFLLEPLDQQALVELFRFLSEFGIKGFILGGGSNILVGDGGFRGVVVRLNRCCQQLHFDGSAVEVGSGVLLERLLDGAGEKSLGGIEFLSDIPGTVGGALKMNAGAWGGEIGQRVETIEVLDPSGRVRHLDRSEVTFHYRRTRGLEGCVTLCTRLRLDPTDPRSSRQERQRLKTLRRERLPLDLPSCGSVFKRFHDTEPPGRLIEQAGCKGLRRGAAEVSHKHANFIVNHGGATAQDVLWLIQEVRRRVLDRFGIELELEVEFVGDFLPPQTQEAG